MFIKEKKNRDVSFAFPDSIIVPIRTNAEKLACPIDALTPPMCPSFLLLIAYILFIYKIKKARLSFTVFFRFYPIPFLPTSLGQNDPSICKKNEMGLPFSIIKLLSTTRLSHASHPICETSENPNFRKRVKR